MALRKEVARKRTNAAKAAAHASARGSNARGVVVDTTVIQPIRNAPNRVTTVTISAPERPKSGVGQLIADFVDNRLSRAGMDIVLPDNKIDGRKAVDQLIEELFSPSIDHFSTDFGDRLKDDERAPTPKDDGYRGSPDKPLEKPAFDPVLAAIGLTQAGAALVNHGAKEAFKKVVEILLHEALEHAYHHATEKPQRTDPKKKPDSDGSQRGGAPTAAQSLRMSIAISRVRKHGGPHDAPGKMREAVVLTEMPNFYDPLYDPSPDAEGNKKTNLRNRPKVVDPKRDDNPDDTRPQKGRKVIVKKRGGKSPRGPGR